MSSLITPNSEWLHDKSKTRYIVKDVGVSVKLEYEWIHGCVSYYNPLEPQHTYVRKINAFIDSFTFIRL